MNRKDHQENLLEILDQLKDCSKHLKISFENCRELDPNSLNEKAAIEFEALTSRFARAVDILIHKVYRAIDSVEFIDGGTLIDVINRADKRKLIDSTQEMRILKDLRNDIAHEYISSRIQLLHREVLEKTPKLIDLIKRALDYCRKFNH